MKKKLEKVTKKQKLTSINEFLQKFTEMFKLKIFEKSQKVKSKSKKRFSQPNQKEMCFWSQEIKQFKNLN